MELIKRRSRAWYVLPILLGWIGGLIGYFAVRHDDPRLAKRLLIVGIALPLVVIAISIIGQAIASILPPS